MLISLDSRVFRIYNFLFHETILHIYETIFRGYFCAVD